MIQPIAAPPSLRDKPNGRMGELQDLLADEARDNHDIRIKADDLVIDEDSGALLLRSLGFKPFELRPLALSQLANRMSVPYSYLSRCPNELAAENLNYWIRKNPDRELMLRCKDDQVRAVLSARYTPIDHVDLMRWISEAFGRDFPLRFELTECSLDVHLLTQGRHQVDENDWLNSGICIRNSEVGMAAVELRGLVYREICLNGLILHGGQKEYRRRHIGNSSIASKVQEVVALLKEEADQTLKGFSDTRRVKVPELFMVLIEVDKRYDLDRGQLEAIEAAHAVEPGDTLYHTINAITRAGNSDQLDLDSRRHLQKIGGRMLALAEKGDQWLE